MTEFPSADEGFLAMFPRYALSVLQRRMKTVPVMLVVGPRQCGKTTLVKSIAQTSDMSYVSCDQMATLTAINFDSVGFLREQKKPLIVDEIQRTPELFLPIKVDVDENRIPGRYLLTGSANPLLSPKLGDSLAGRIGVCNLWPLSQGELIGVKETFIEKILSRTPFSQTQPLLTQQDFVKKVVVGGFPSVVSATSAQERNEWCNDYLFNVLRKDIIDLAKIEHFSQLPALLYGLANRVGSTLNISSLVAVTHASEATLRRYLELLKNLFLIVLLPAWSKNGDKRLSKAPKAYFSDTALLVSTLNFDEQRILTTPNVFGHLFENFVVMELIKQATWCSELIHLYHYRTLDQNEVDIVLESPSGKVVGIEIKLADVVRKEDLKGLQSLQEQAGERFHRGIVLYTGNQTIPFGSSFSAVPITALWS